MPQRTPEWFPTVEEANPQVMRRIAQAVSSCNMGLQVKSSPMLAHWFMLDSLMLANQANRDGMHANALVLTRQCLEAISVIELGICGHVDAEAMLIQWNEDRLSPGKLRAWLEQNVWPRYGAGLWNEPWSTFMREFAAAVQPYAHYGRSLAQWQLRLRGFTAASNDPAAVMQGVIELQPRAYDPQKATRITLFHGVLAYVLGRIWMAQSATDAEFASLMNHLRIALGKSRYLDGHQTDWSQQFWAMVWSSDGGTVLE